MSGRSVRNVLKRKCEDDHGKVVKKRRQSRNNKNSDSQTEVQLRRSARSSRLTQSMIRSENTTPCLAQKAPGYLEDLERNIDEQWSIDSDSTTTGHVEDLLKSGDCASDLVVNKRLCLKRKRKEFPPIPKSPRQKKCKRELKSVYPSDDDDDEICIKVPPRSRTHTLEIEKQILRDTKNPRPSTSRALVLMMAKSNKGTRTFEKSRLNSDTLKSSEPDLSVPRNKRTARKRKPVVAEQSSIYQDNSMTDVAGKNVKKPNVTRADAPPINRIPDIETPTSKNHGALNKLIREYLLANCRGDMTMEQLSLVSKNAARVFRYASNLWGTKFLKIEFPKLLGEIEDDGSVTSAVKAILNAIVEAAELDKNLCKVQQFLRAVGETEAFKNHQTNYEAIVKKTERKLGRVLKVTIGKKLTTLRPRPLVRRIVDCRCGC